MITVSMSCKKCLFTHWLTHPPGGGQFKLLSTPSVGGMTAQIVSNAQLPNLPRVINAARQHFFWQKPGKIYSPFYKYNNIK